MLVFDELLQQKRINEKERVELEKEYKLQQAKFEEVQTFVEQGDAMLELFHDGFQGVSSELFFESKREGFVTMLKNQQEQQQLMEVEYQAKRKKLDLFDEEIEHSLRRLNSDERG